LGGLQQTQILIDYGGIVAVAATEATRKVKCDSTAGWFFVEVFATAEELFRRYILLKGLACCGYGPRAQ